MEKLKACVNKDKCDGCGVCVTVCPTDSIKIVNNKAVIDDTCIACGACVSVCPVECIELKMTKSEKIK